MIYKLENNNISITASTYGGELHSLTSKAHNTEYLWNGNPDYWKYHAPILFPIVGKVKDSKYRVNGESYELPQHGLARVSEFELCNKTETSISFILNFSEETLKVYPFKFSLEITYTLLESGVKTSYTVKNLDNKNILFSIGAHPAYMCPIDPSLSLNDYYFEFDKKENKSIMLITKEGLFSKEKEDFLKNENIIPLSKELFKNDALVFHELQSKFISIKSNKDSKSLNFNFNNFPYLGLWAPASGSPFVCIEPWYGHADYEDFNGEFKDKEGVISLPLNEKFTCSYEVTI